MARLISYPIISTSSLALGDLFPVTDMSAASRPLKNVTVESLTNFVISKSPFAFNATHPTAIQSANNLALGTYSTAMGLLTTASGQSSTAMGESTTASGQSSTAIGAYTQASGDASTAMGEETEASADYSTAMGKSTEATGDYSTAMGRETNASGYSSTAMGAYTQASGLYSTAMGYDTTASGNASTAIGYLTTASGTYSTAMGYNTTASGSVSTAMGSNTEASGYSSLAIGQYNVINNGDSANVYAATNTAFSIGNGTSSASRSNALSVLFNGNVTAGSVIATSLEVERPDSGLILKSPDGTRYRITMANGGSLVITAV
jgi:hypothetical protein